MFLRTLFIQKPFARLVFGVAGCLVAGVVSPASAQTLVCGPILANTTWDLSGSPWELTCDVSVLGGATLTIDPGVAVVFHPGTQLVVQAGNVVAIGTPFLPISFSSFDTTNPGNGVRVVPGSTVTVSHGFFQSLNYGVQISCCGTPAGPPLVASYCSFSQCGTGVQGYAGGSQAEWAQITFCTFNSCYTGVDSADKFISSCLFTNNVIGIGTIERTTVEDSTIQGNVTGIQTAGNNYNVTVERCLIDSNTTGIVNAATTRRCTITNNNVGVTMNTQVLFECNNIQSNDNYNVSLNTATSLSIDDNWWGTTNTTMIDASIYDGFDQTGIGFALYSPALAGIWESTTTCMCTTPSVTTQPTSQSVYDGDIATFTVAASFVGAPTYQWRRNGVALPIWSPRFGFSNTATLTINPVARPGSEPTWTDAGTYDCVITNVCGTAISNGAALTVTICTADHDQNGIVQVPDIFSFLSSWFAGCP